MIKIGIAGCKGRMGKELIKQVAEQKGVTLCAGLVASEENCANEISDNLYPTTDMNTFFRASDVVIDFTCPEASLENIKRASIQKTPILVGTSGLDEKHRKAAEATAKNTAIIIAPNTSLTVNVMLAMAKKMAAVLDESFDVEIEETHHRHKVDAPSGTAFAIGKSIAEGRGINLDSKAIFDRHHINKPRENGEIGFTAMRGGNIAGEHTVHFYGNGESLSLNSRVFDRAIFAKGALTAACWLSTQKPGLYTMADVLEL